MKKSLLFYCSCLLSLGGFAQSEAIVVQQWMAEYGQENAPTHVATALDNDGNVYFAARVTSTVSGFDFLTLKYDAEGNQLWTATYNGIGNGDDTPSALILDQQGNVYVTGKSKGVSSDDFATVKYSSSGVQQWERRYNGASNLSDEAVALAIDGNSLFVGGRSQAASTGVDYLIIKYNAQNGNLGWEKRHSSSGNNSDMLNALAIDNSGDVVVTGKGSSLSTGEDFLTAKFNSVNGNLIWEKKVNGSASLDDEPSALAIDHNNNILVAGATHNTSTGKDITTIKYSSVGVELWSKRADSNSMEDNAHSIAVDSDDNIYVAGSTKKIANNSDYITLKYNSNGTEEWRAEHNGVGNGNDAIRKLVVDNNNDVFVTGEAFNGNNHDYTTIKYNNLGEEKWRDVYNGSANQTDKPTDLAKSSNSEVAVTGHSIDNNGKNRFTTIKYKRRDLVKVPDPEIAPLPFAYESYVGQFLTTDGSKAEDLVAFNNKLYPPMYLGKESITHVFTEEDTTIDQSTYNRVDMSFVGRNSHVSIAKLDRTPVKTNYYKEFAMNGLVGIPSYRKIVYTNLYPLIDLQVSSNEMGVKYYFVVNSASESTKPGIGGNTVGNPENIELQFDGADAVNINSDGSLEIVSALGSLVLEAPHVYHINPSGQIIPVLNQGAFYKSAANRVKFDISETANTMPLVIQVDKGHKAAPAPATDNMMWSSYWGGENSDEFKDVTNDKVGNTFLTGQTVCSAFPTSSGIIIGSYKGSYDNIIIKMNDKVEPQWMTYYGGQEFDTPNNSVTNSSGDLFVVGHTNSVNFPTIGDSTSYIDNVNDTSISTFKTDVFILKFSGVDGLPLWSTLYGGPESEGAKDVAIDQLGAVYVVGYGKPSTPLYNPNNGSYFNDATGYGLILKFSKFGERLWATRFGGNDQNEAIADIETMKPGKIVITGVTESNNFPILNAGVDSIRNGAQDVFLTLLTEDVLTWSTYISGDKTDYVYALAVNSKQDIFVTGMTKSGHNSINPFPVKDYNPLSEEDYFEPEFQSNIPSNDYVPFDMFIVQVDKLGALEWSTYFGGEMEDQGFDIKIDGRDYIYLVGFSSSETMPMPSVAPYNYFVRNSISGTAGADEDGILAAFTPNRKLVWTTYYGCGGVPFPAATEDRIRAVSVFGDKDLYITGATLNFQHTDFPLVEFSTSSNLDYYQSNPAPFGTGSIGSGYGARFDVTNITTVGINEALQTQNNLGIYPNPSNGQITVMYKAEMSSKLEVFNNLGSTVYKENLSASKGMSQKQIDLSSLSNGVYLIMLSEGDNNITQKLIIQH